MGSLKLSLCEGVVQKSFELKKWTCQHLYLMICSWRPERSYITKCWCRTCVFIRAIGVSHGKRPDVKAVLQCLWSSL